MRRVVFALLVAIGLASPAVAADFQVGVDAVKRGDYATAIREFRELAAQGHSGAQTNLGLMLSKGWGTPPDDAEAVKWYLQAAEQGQPVAQNNLGALYLTGSGVPKDPVVSMMWLMLASENGYAAASSAVEQQTQQMTPRQLDVAKRLAAVWKEKLALNK
jgi:uncharacterized protein